MTDKKGRGFKKYLATRAVLLLPAAREHIVQRVLEGTAVHVN